MSSYISWEMPTCHSWKTGLWWKWRPYKVWSLELHLCKKGQKWPSQCQPSHFYRRAQMQPCCLHPAGLWSCPFNTHGSEITIQEIPTLTLRTHSVYKHHESFSFMMSLLATSFGDRICFSRKGGIRGGGWVHYTTFNKSSGQTALSAWNALKLNWCSN